MPKINKNLTNVTRPSSVFPSRRDKVRLNWNELSPGYPEETIKQMLAAITPAMISGYPEYDEIYPLMAQYLGLQEDQILLESGSECGIKNVFEVFVPEGSTVVLPCPEFVMVDVYAGIFGAGLRRVDFDGDLNLSVRDLVDSIKEDTSLVYLANPNAPTGYTYALEDIKGILERAASLDAVVLVDECYIDFSDRPSCLDIITHHDNLIVSRSFSKSFGLAGVRLGVLATNRELNGLLHKTRPMREINAFAAEFGKFMLKNIHIPKAMIREIVQSREWVGQTLLSLGYEVKPSATNFILVNFGDDTQAFIKKCERHDVLVKYGLGHQSVDPYVCLTIGTQALMEDVIARIFPL